MERCIGRERELGVLDKAYELASRSGERLVLVRGPAGVGKSRLMAEFRRRTRLSGAVVLEGRCSVGARALAPLAEILGRAIHFLEEVGRPAEEFVDLDRLAFVLGEHRPVELVDAGGSLIEKRVQLFEAYCGVLREVSRIKPPVVMIHDLHWADPLTVELMTYLMDRGGTLGESPVVETTMYGLVLASIRSGELEEATGQLGFHPKVRVLDLEGFDDAAIREYLQSSSIVRRLNEVTGGNPAELEALFLSPKARADDVLRGRVDKLTDEGRRLLGALAVLGRQSPAMKVVEVAGVTSPSRALADLQESGLVLKSLRDGEITLRMARAHYSGRVYGWLDNEERRRLHCRVAELNVGANGLEIQDLAVHAIRAGEGQLAVKAATRAAQALEVACAYEAATHLLEEALELADEEQRVELQIRLARLCLRTGAYAEGLGHALAVIEARPDDVESVFIAGRLAVLRGEFKRASGLLDRASGLARAGDRSDLLDELAAAKAEAEFRCSRFDAALAECERCSPKNPSARIALRNVRGKVELSRRRYQQAREAFQENLADARARSDQRLESQALTNLGIVFMREHDYDRATQCFDAALKQAEEVHDLRESAIALENLGVLAHLRGDIGEALRRYHAALAALKTLGNKHMQARAAQNLAELHLLLGDVERAVSIVDFIGQLDDGTLPPEVVGEGLLLRARLSIAEGELHQASRFLDNARSIYRKVEDEARLAEVALVSGQLELKRSDIGAARAALDLVWRSAELETTMRGDAAMLEAELERSRFGDPLRSLLLAVESYDSAGDREKGWRAHLQLSRAYGARGEGLGRERHLRRAIVLERSVRETVPRELHNALARTRERQQLVEQAASLDVRAEASHPESESVESETRASRDARPPSAPAPRRPSPTPSPKRIAAFRRRFPHIVFESEEMTQVMAKAERVARSDSQVLIRGESGTGKELVAEVLHGLSDRRDKPIVKVNCAALVESLLLDELFGHEKGAFTGALKCRKGRFELADGGTLFLDEIGDISPNTQVALLRVLQEQVFERVGGSRTIRVDVRLICATNRDLEAAVAEGTFREDLYYRLKGVPLEVPPLRERQQDIAPLAEHFLKCAARATRRAPMRLTKDAIQCLEHHPWPGNIRELENVMQSVALMVDTPTIDAGQITEHSGLVHPSFEGASTPTPLPRSTPTLIPTPLPTPASTDSGVGVAPVPDVEEEEPPEEAGRFDEVLDGELSLRQWQKQAEREYIERALERTSWNITRAAVLLGMKRPRLSQLVKEHGLSNRSQDGSQVKS